MATKKNVEKNTKESKKTPKEKAPKEKAPKEKAPKEKAPKPEKPFEHDPRVLPYVGKILTHTERDGDIHEMEVRADGFYVGRTRYNSATAAAKPFQPVDDEGRSRPVNGLVYWNIVQAPRAAISPEAALESAQKAIDKALQRAALAVEAASDKKGAVTRLLQSAVKKFEKLLNSATVAPKGGRPKKEKKVEPAVDLDTDDLDTDDHDTDDTDTDTE